jgi:hypothetical protein
MVTAGNDPARVVVLTTFDDDDCVYGALRAGASGFLVKDMALDDILAVIRVVAAGDALIAPGVTRRLIAQFTARPASIPPGGNSTESPNANARCSRSSPAACPTAKSPDTSSSARPPPRPTWRACSPSWAPVTESSSSSPPTKPAWYQRPAMRRPDRHLEAAPEPAQIFEHKRLFAF